MECNPCITKELLGTKCMVYSMVMSKCVHNDTENLPNYPLPKQRMQKRPPAGIVPCWCPLSDGQYIPHGVRCLPLCRCGDMGVGIQSEPGGEVSQHAGDGLDIHAILQCQGGEGVPEVVEPDLWQPCPGQHPMEHVEDAVRGHGAAGR